MNTAEDFIILQGHVYQHNNKKFWQKDSPNPRNKKIPVILWTHLVIEEQFQHIALSQPNLVRGFL